MTATYIVTRPPASGWDIQCMDGLVGMKVAHADTQALAVRICELLNRHGMVDIPMGGIGGPGDPG